MPEKSVDTTPIQIRLPNPMLEAIDLAIKIGQGSNRTDVIRTAIATYLKDLSVTTEMKKRKFK